MLTIPKTVIVDLDGTVFKHHGEALMGQILKPAELLPGVAEKFKEWDTKGYKIVILTGRRESMREHTINQLHQFGLAYDALVMGVGGGQRYLINDSKPNGLNTAFGVNVNRNEGLKGVEI